ncbi:hypothetical protein HG530_009200 [Fusarium avenaceum]|nr:hypothetical protein HG530_009200 [Fusarium avenaceum]
MTELVGNWLRFTTQQPKRKRAEADQDCHQRPSKRGRQRRRAPTQAERGTESGTIIQGDQGMVESPASAVASTPRVVFALPPTEPPPEVAITQPTQADTSPTEGAGRSHAGDVDTGFLQIYGPENQLEAEQQELVANLELRNPASDPRQQELQQSFSETYFEYCYPWCPVLDRQTLESELERSPMLANALALAASHIQPPLIPHEGPASYYKKARMMFYEDEEPDILTALKAISLFYWWAPRSPATAHRHASWWWTSVIIRHAQQMNIHREPQGDSTVSSELHLSLRRRLWWTVFARERLTSLCQSKPCIICPEDMTIKEVQPADFPSDLASQKKGRIFKYWVRLSGIMGKVSKALSKSVDSTSAPFPTELRQELVEWVQSLPPDLQLPIGSSRTESFDRDVHQLHLPYLTTIIVMHLQRTTPDLPQALPPAILAASCIARILRDILSRGNARFLMAITCWYCGTAFIALLQATRIKQFSKEAEDGLDILDQAVGQLQLMWASANTIRQGFERLRALPRTMMHPGRSRANEPGDPYIGSKGASNTSNDFDWPRLFPFVTRSTSRIADCLLADNEFGTTNTALPSPENAIFHEDLLNRIHLKSREPIAHEPEWVRRVVSDVEILSTDITEHAIEEMGATTKQGCDSPVHLASLIPTGASTTPDEGFVNLVAILDEGVHLVFLGDNVLDIFGCHLLDPLDKVVTCPVERLHERTVSTETVWTHHHEVVGHGWDSN